MCGCVRKIDPMGTTEHASIFTSCKEFGWDVAKRGETNLDGDSYGSSEAYGASTGPYVCMRHHQELCRMLQPTRYRLPLSGKSNLKGGEKNGYGDRSGSSEVANPFG